MQKGRIIFAFLPILWMLSTIDVSGQTMEDVKLTLNKESKSQMGKMTDLDYFIMGKELSERNHLMEANEILRALKEEFPKSPYIPESIFLMGKNFLLIERFSDAVDSFDSFLSQYPAHEKADKAIMYLALSLERSGNIKRAKTIFHKIRSKFQDLRGLPNDVLLSLLRTYQRAGDPDEFSSLAFYVLNVISEPSMERDLYRLIHTFYKERERERSALKVISGALFLRQSLNPDQEELMKFADLWMEHPGMGSIPNLLIGKGYLSPREIYVDFAKAHPLEREAKEAMYKAGKVSLESGQFIEAIHTFKGLLSLSVEGPFFRKCLEAFAKGVSRLFEKRGSGCECMEVVKLYIQELREIEDAPLDPETFLKIGECLRIEGLQDLAISIYRKALKAKLEPQTMEKAILGLSEIYLSEKRWKECLETIRSLPKRPLTESIGRTLEIMGEALFQMGQFQEIIEVMSPHLNRLSQGAKFWLAMAFLWTEKIERAEKALREVIGKTEGGTSENNRKIEDRSLLYLGDILFERNQLEDAKTIYMDLLGRKLHPSVISWVLYRLACIKIKEGEGKKGDTPSEIPDEGKVEPLWAHAISAMNKTESIMKGTGIVWR